MHYRTARRLLSCVVVPIVFIANAGNTAPPDISGTYDVATLTPLERPDAFGLTPASMGFLGEPQFPVRYRGFILLQQPNQSWLVRPERSPMQLLPFRTVICSLEDAKSLVDWKLEAGSNLIEVA